MTYVARCYHCDWGLTHDRDIVQESSLSHVWECPGPVIAVRPESPSSGMLTFKSRLRCPGCGLPKTVCVCQPVE